MASACCSSPPVIITLVSEHHSFLASGAYSEDSFKGRLATPHSSFAGARTTTDTSKPATGFEG